MQLNAIFLSDLKNIKYFGWNVISCSKYIIRR